MCWLVNYKLRFNYPMFMYFYCYFKQNLIIIVSTVALSHAAISASHYYFRQFLTVYFWFQEINYDSPRGGVSVITEKGDITVSYLLVQRARNSDSGKYTCNPSNANPKTVTVHVLNGKSKHDRNNKKSVDFIALYQIRWFVSRHM